MSCPNCYQLSGCNCLSELPASECSCSDPGLETSLKHIGGYDGQFCSRRLQTVPGFLFSSSTGQILFSTEPRVPLTTLTVNEGDKFGSLVICRGSNGVMQRVTPADGVDGILKADGDGNFYLVDPTSEFTVPDPLTITQLNATTVNVTTLNVGGVPTFSSLNTDTITTTIGLNGSNQLVKGSTPTISVASYFENDSLVGSGTPNWTPANATDNCVIGNELTDPDSIASVQDSKTIRIDKAGDYIIQWRGVFSGWDPLSGSVGTTILEPGIWLSINSAVVDYGAKYIQQTRSYGGVVGGEYVAVGLTVGTLIRLPLNGSIQTNPAFSRKTGLTGVGLILSKIK